MSYKLAVRSPCPACGEVLGAAFSQNATGLPRAGDVSICIQCAAVNVYADSLGNLRAPTDAEMAMFRHTEVWPVIREAIRKVLRVKGIKP